MATPADQRLLELLEKWLKSLELHLRYSSLDSDSYLQVQPWPEHQRPSRWIIELAMQKAQALRAQVEERIKMGDAKFSDSLELMTFLANLLGSEHIERFIPLADPRPSARHVVRRPVRRRARRSMPAPAPAKCWLPLPGPAKCPSSSPAKRRSAPVGTATVARTERKGAGSAKAPAKAAAKPPGRIAAPTKPAAAVKPAGGSEAAGESAARLPRTGHRRRCATGAVGPQVV